jgi:Flp pilus assembly pilin Flp
MTAAYYGTTNRKHGASNLRGFPGITPLSNMDWLRRGSHAIIWAVARPSHRQKVPGEETIWQRSGSMRHGPGDMANTHVLDVGNESGVTAIEYGLIAAGVGVSILTVVHTVGGALVTIFATVTNDPTTAAK